MGRAGRLNSGKCLKCGDALVLGADELPLTGPYQMCSKCTDLIERARYDLKKKVDQKKLDDGIILQSQQILRQIGVMGPDTGGVKFGPSKIRPE